MKMRSKREKKLADDSKLRTAYRRWRRERVEVLLAGPYGEPTRALLAFLKVMRRPTELVDFVKAGPWREANEDVRNEILALIDATIIRQRQHLGLQAFDDALPGEPPNVFLILRDYLAPDFPSVDGAIRGEARPDETNPNKTGVPCPTILPKPKPDSETTASILHLPQIA